MNMTNDPVEEFLKDIDFGWHREPSKLIQDNDIDKLLALVRVYKEELIRIDYEFCGSPKMSETVGTLYVRLKRIREAVLDAEEKAKEIVKK